MGNGGVNMKGMKTKGMECTCDWGGGILSIIMIALGIWFLAGGFATQLNVTMRNFDWTVAAWYVIGVALFMYGKMWGTKSCGGCPMHGEACCDMH